MENFIVGLVLSHQQMIEGAVIGYALGHVPQAVAFLFHQAMRVPVIRAAILANPAKAKELAKQIEQEFEKDVDEEVSSQPQGH